MYGIIIGIIVGFVTSGWLFVFIVPPIHGIAMAVRKLIKKPDAIEASVYKKMEDSGTKAFSDQQVPVLEFITEGSLCLIAASITYGIRLML